MKAFCNVGKTVLSKALGLQKNYSEVLERAYEVLDEDASGCGTCKWHALRTVTHDGEELFAECERACASCPHRVMKVEYTYSRVYHNERNRCGYKPRLKCNAIKLLLAFHFYEIDQNGLIYHIDVSALAEKLGCNIKTVNNNLEQLREYGYISFSRIDSRLINLYLPEYEDYFKPASSGGRGFLVISENVFSELLKIDSINTLRITLRQLMEFDQLKNHGTDSVEKSYHDLRMLLPDYCKRNVIQKASDKLSMFVTEIKDNLIKFILKPEFDAKHQKEERLQFYEEQLTEFWHEFTEEAGEINTGIHSIDESKFAGFFEGIEVEEYVGWSLSPLDVADLAYLCLQYSFNVVLKALQQIYQTYILKFTKITNLGGLARTIIHAMYRAA